MKPVKPEVTNFLSKQPLRLFIGGHWIESASGDTFETRDLGTGAVLARVAAGDTPDIERAVRAADEAYRHSDWAAMPANDRAVIP